MSSICLSGHFTLTAINLFFFLVHQCCRYESGFLVSGEHLVKLLRRSHWPWSFGFLKCWNPGRTVWNRWWRHLFDFLLTYLVFFKSLLWYLDHTWLLFLLSSIKLAFLRRLCVYLWLRLCLDAEWAFSQRDISFWKHRRSCKVPMCLAQLGICGSWKGSAALHSTSPYRRCSPKADVPLIIQTSAKQQRGWSSKLFIFIIWQKVYCSSSILHLSQMTAAVIYQLNHRLSIAAAEHSSMFSWCYPGVFVLHDILKSSANKVTLHEQSRKFSPEQYLPRLCCMFTGWRHVGRVKGHSRAVCKSVFECSPHAQTAQKTKDNHENALPLPWSLVVNVPVECHGSLFSRSLVHFLPYLKHFWWLSCLTGFADSSQWPEQRKACPIISMVFAGTKKKKTSNIFPNAVCCPSK